MTEFIMNLSPGYLYPALFIGLVMIGGAVLLPAMYLTLTESLNITHLFVIAVLAGIASDSFWYLIGLKAKKDRLYRLSFVRKRMRDAEKFSAFFSRRGVLLVFVTKFVYGTRIASHVLAGMHRIRFPWFTAATSLGTSIWFWFLYYLVKAVDYGVASAKSTALRAQLLLLIVLSILVAINWFTGTVVKSKIEKHSDSRKGLSRPGRA